jgi:two-component system, OmpR family, sensor kinase
MAGQTTDDSSNTGSNDLNESRTAGSGRVREDLLNASDSSTSKTFSSSGANIGLALDALEAEDSISAPKSRSRTRGLSLKWRIGLGTAALLLVFAAILAGSISFIVNSTLERYQHDLLDGDAQTIKKFYKFLDEAGNDGLDLKYRLFDKSNYALYYVNGNFFNGSEIRVPRLEILKARYVDGYWGTNTGRTPIRVILKPIDLNLGQKSYRMILAVSADATYIVTISRLVTSTILIVTSILALIALTGGYFAASAMLRPLIEVARQATKLDEHNLEPLRYTGPRDELGLLTATLNQLVRRLKRAFEAQKVFLAETSHELRTPLTALQGYLRRALRDPNPHAALEDALRVTDSMTRLVNDVLQLSRGEIVQEIVPHLVDLGEVAQNVAREFPGVSVKLDPGLEMIGDPDRLSQLTRNLVANAIRAVSKAEGAPANPADGVHIEVRRLEKPVVPTTREVQAREIRATLELHVRDDGPGIPAQVLPRMFEKFYRGPGGGSGLGLAIASQIVRGHNGEIAAQNDPGRGAHFTVTLPALSDDDAPEDD